MRRKWRVISHPLNTNPFPGSFLNYKAKIRLRDVTISTATFLEIEAEFDTEHTVGPVTASWFEHRSVCFLHP